MPVKHCSWGTCSSDNRCPLPNQRNRLKKCLRWIKAPSDVHTVPSPHPQMPGIACRTARLSSESSTRRRWMIKRRRRKHAGVPASSSMSAKSQSRLTSVPKYINFMLCGRNRQCIRCRTLFVEFTLRVISQATPISTDSVA